ncbi:MAG: hypothetical protein OXF93_22360 [Acidobacteria bacterium]|nr:hypothetical protein [Acidobacteriota bacterium]
MRSPLTAALVVALTLGANATGVAQQPDFSGTWSLDRDASEVRQPGGFLGRLARRGFGGERGGGGGGFGGPGGGGLGAAAESLVITQTGEDLTIDQWSARGARTLHYRLDGQPSTNPGLRGDVTTTSQWDGALIVTEGNQEVSTPRGEISIDLVERRSLSADGQTMTVESTRTLPFGDITITLVYRKELR